MKMKKTMKIVISILIILYILTIETTIFALDPEDYAPGILKYGDAKVLFDKAAPVIKLISDVGIIMSVVAISVIGLKYMFGSTLEQKAKIKEMLFPLICGCLLLVGTFTVVKIIASISNEELYTENFYYCPVCRKKVEPDPRNGGCPNCGAALMTEK